VGLGAVRDQHVDPAAGQSGEEVVLAGLVETVDLIDVNRPIPGMR